MWLRKILTAVLAGAIVLAASGQGQAAATVPAEDPSGKNVNDQVLKLYKQGKSVVEISKELNVGQGEVKLTLALYGGNR